MTAPDVQLEHFGEGLRPWWQSYGNDPTEGPDDGKIWVSPDAPRHGTYGLICHIKQGNLYLYFKPWDGRQHFYAHELIQKGTWKPQTYNRLRLWLKPSRWLVFPTDGTPNIHLGTYTRASSVSRREQESGNGHWYYHHLLYPGAWNLIEVDLNHPHMQRNVYAKNGGPKEWGRLDTPTGRPGPWMADVLTSFYLDAKKKLPFRSQYWLDSVTFTTVSKDEPIEDIYGVTAAYSSKKQKTMLSWSKRMDQGGQLFDVYWSEKSIRQFGLKSAQKVGEGIIGLGTGGYNQCAWIGALPLQHLPRAYFAIQQQGSKKFRHIVLDLK